MRILMEVRSCVCVRACAYELAELFYNELLKLAEEELEKKVTSSNQ
jgi:hypothetical protein